MIQVVRQVAAVIEKSSVDIPKVELDNTQFQSVLSAVFGLAGIVAVIFIILGGYKYATSQGNPGDLEKGKNMIVYALVGLGIVIFGFTIVQFVTARLFS